MIGMPSVTDGRERPTWTDNDRARYAAVMTHAVRSLFDQRRPAVRAVGAVRQRRRPMRFSHFFRGILIGLAVVTVVWVTIL